VYTVVSEEEVMLAASVTSATLATSPSPNGRGYIEDHDGTKWEGKSASRHSRRTRDFKQKTVAIS